MNAPKFRLGEIVYTGVEENFDGMAYQGRIQMARFDPATGWWSYMVNAGKDYRGDVTTWLGENQIKRVPKPEEETTPKLEPVKVPGVTPAGGGTAEEKK